MASAPLPELSPATTAATLPSGLLPLLNALPFEWFVVDKDFQVVTHSISAHEFGISNTISITNRDVRKHLTRTWRHRTAEAIDLDFSGDGRQTLSQAIRIRCCPISTALSVVLIEDISGALRVDAMRRDFIVNVSHELKTPVGALLLLAEATRSALGDPDAVQHFTHRIQLEVERLSKLVIDLTDLSRLQAGLDQLRVSQLPVRRLIRESVDAVQVHAEQRDIELRTSVANDLTVFGDEELLATAIRNLLINALNYSPDHTHVTISARSSEHFVEIVVSDQGIGISESDQTRIFERFYRVDPARSRASGGTGLGLAIVKHICALHHGECTVWSRPGEGSTFTLRLPLHPTPRLLQRNGSTE